MNTRFIKFCGFFALLFFCLSAQAQKPKFAVPTPESLAFEILDTQREISSLEAQLTSREMRLVKKGDKRSIASLNPEAKSLYQQREIYKAHLFDLKNMDGIRMALKQQFQKAYPNTEITPEFDSEVARLAIVVVPEIARLRGVYQSIAVPIVHNMMIDIGIRDRGACKHWAEDLITFLRHEDRKYFDLMWGTANSGKLNEHNVAVLVPKGAPFDTGLIIDPWRTSGLPWWSPVPLDKKYPWTPWVEYGRF